MILLGLLPHVNNWTQAFGFLTAVIFSVGEWNLKFQDYVSQLA